MLNRLMFVFMFAVLLVSCGNEPPAVNREPLKVEFAFWWGDFTLLVAREKGFFEKHGVAVEPVYYESFSQAPADMAAGKIDAGLFSIGDVIISSEHTQVKVVAAYDDGGLNTVVAIPEITSVAELKGRHIGVKIGSPYEIFVREMLKTAGLKASDVVFVNLSAEEIPVAMPDNVQAGFVWEPHTSELTAKGYRVLFSSTQISSLYPDLITFRAAVVRERPGDVTAFLKAWFEAVEYRNKHVEETREIAAKYLGVTSDEVLPDDQLHIMTLDDNRLLFQQTPADGSRSIYDTAQISVDFLIDIGSLSQQPDLKTIFDFSHQP
jgi:NitT/TauT family transport system substrate-binding protein